MSNQSDVPAWIGPKEALKILGVTRNTLKRLVREGILPAYRIEGVVGLRFKPPEVEALIKPVVPEAAGTQRHGKSKRSSTRKAR